MKIIIKDIKPQVKAELPSYQEVSEKFKNGEIVGFQTEREKFRLFIAQGGILCYYRKGSSRRGYSLSEANIIGFRKWIVEKEVSADDAAWKIIDKYRSYSEKASFTNPFIKKCLELPKSFEQWESDGKKSLYEYNVTTGVAKEGEVITIEGLKKAFRVEPIINAIKNKTNYNSGIHDFRGYDTSVSINVDGGELKGYLSLEYRGCGNGHYYLLVNDDCFIYYDKD